MVSVLSKNKEEYVPKTGVLGDATDYNVYVMSRRQKVLNFVVGAVVCAAVGYIFYESIVFSMILGVIGGTLYIGIRRKQLIKKRKNILLLQFKDMLDALSTSLGAGKNVFDAFCAASEDLSVEHSQSSDIVTEISIILNGISNNITIETLLEDFGSRSGLKEVQDFASVFATCYRKGGNIRDVIQNTTEVITDEIETNMEITTMVSGKTTEQNVMMCMPIAFVAVLKGMGGNLVDLSSALGIICMTIAIALFVVAYFWSKKTLDISL